MNYLFDYGEALFCFVPVFFIIAFIFATLIWNSLPEQAKERTTGSEEIDLPKR
jgi:hypothetical protein